jgi:hypothetical protein
MSARSRARLPCPCWNLAAEVPAARSMKAMRENPVGANGDRVNAFFRTVKLFNRFRKKQSRV